MSLDQLQSLPFRYELLVELSRADVLVLSAVLYAIRLYGVGKWVRVTDDAIRRQTGLSRATIYRARKRLVGRGLITVDENWYNFYMVTREQERAILDVAREAMDEREQRILESFTLKQREYALILIELLDTRVKASWRPYLQQMVENAVTREEVEEAINQMRRKGLVIQSMKALLSRVLNIRKGRAARQKAQQQQQQQYYHYKWDKARFCYVRIPLPPGASNDIFDEPVP